MPFQSTLLEQKLKLQRLALPVQCASPVPCSGLCHTGPAAAPGHLTETAPAAGPLHLDLRPKLWPGQCKALPGLQEVPATLLGFPVALPATINQSNLLALLAMINQSNISGMSLPNKLDWQQS